MALAVICLAAGQLFVAVALIGHGYRIGLLKEKIMALADDLNAINAQLAKVKDEIVSKVDTLENALRAAGEPDPAVLAAVDNLRSTAQGLDDLVPDPAA